MSSVRANEDICVPPAACCCCCRGSEDSLARFQGGQGFQRITQLLQWAALSGDDAALATEPGDSLQRIFGALSAWAQPAPQRRRQQQQQQQQQQRRQHPRPAAAGQGSPGGAAAPPAQQDAAAADARLQLLLAAMVDAFRPAIATSAAGSEAALAYHSQAATALACSTCALQRSVLQFASDLLPARGEAAAALGLLRGSGLWDAAFGPAFFFWGVAAVVESPRATPEPSPGSAELPEELLAELTMERSGSAQGE